MDRMVSALVAAASSLADGCLGSSSANADGGGDCGETGQLLPEKEKVPPAAAVREPGRWNDPFEVCDAYGNCFPDFATCGFRAGSRLPSDLPPVVNTVCPASPPCDGDDDTARIQSAIDAAGSLSPAGCFRGTVLLRAGIYRVSSSINVRHSGVVLRGEDGAVIIATGKSRRTLIAVGSDPAGRKLQTISKKVPVTDIHVPVGSRRLHISERVPGLKVGDCVVVSRPGTSEWIHAIGMDAIPPRPDNSAPSTQWDPKKYGLDQERVVVGVGREPCGKEYIDVEPGLAMDLRDTFGGGLVYKCAWTPTEPANMIGVENIKLVSEYELGREDGDEDHCTLAVQLDHCQNCWVCNVTATHFLSGFKAAYCARRCTLLDCLFIDPVSKLAGGRRYGFEIDGTEILVRRCRSRLARHAFVTSSKVRGPNAFVDCTSEQDFADSGPHHRWATGTLYDCVRIGGQLNCMNRSYLGTGHGWAGAFHVYWNCECQRCTFQSPPFATNFIVGNVGPSRRPTFPGESALVVSSGSHVEPRSLWEWQMRQKGRGMEI